MYPLLKSFLLLTAWPMTPPEPYSAFHILLMLFGSAAAICLARIFSKKVRYATEPDTYIRQILFTCGLILAVMEIYKQAFLYVIEFNGHFDWWYFPFQLCSIPMYLCLAAPFLVSRTLLRRTATFLQDFALLGGIMALAVPPGLMHPYWTMTLHGFFWHFILLFLGLFCCMTGAAGRETWNFTEILPFFLLCCLTAALINIAAGPDTDADMFYISPFHPSSQPVFHQIAEILGIIPGNLLYICTVILGGFLVHIFIQKISPQKKDPRRGA